MLMAAVVMPEPLALAGAGGCSPSSCPRALEIPHPGTGTAQPSIPSTKKGGSLSAHNQKVVNDIRIRHRKLD